MDEDSTVPGNGLRRSTTGDGSRVRSLVWSYGDLGVVVLLACVGAVAVVLPSLVAVRPILALPLVVLWPGYALVAALYPEHDALDDVVGESGGLERLVLSVGLSLVTSPLLALVLNYTLWGVRPVPVFVGLALLTCAAAVVAWYRRRQLGPDRRFQARGDRWLTAARTRVTQGGTLDTVLVVVIAAGVVVSAVSISYLVVTPRPGEQFSEFYLLTETSDGDYVAADYPTSFVRGEPKPLVVGITNREHRAVTYNVVVVLQRTRVGPGDGTPPSDEPLEVLEREELRRFEDVRLEHGQEWRRAHEIQPSMTGEDLRVVYLLYRGAPPPEPTLDNADRSTHIWVDVAATES